MAKTILFLCIMLFSFSIWASGPESFDHLLSYKSKNPPVSHPLVENMIVDSTNKASAHYSYNQQGQLVRSDYTSEGEKDGYTLYHYKNGVLLGQTLYNRNQEVVEKLFFTWNEQGQITRYEMQDPQGKVEMYWLFRYNARGLVSGKRMAENKVSESFVLEYQSNGNYIQKVYSANAEKLAEIHYIFENKKLKQKKQVSTGGKRQVDYIYNSQGHLIQMIFSSSNSENPSLKKIKTHVLKYSSRLQSYNLRYFAS